MADGLNGKDILIQGAAAADLEEIFTLERSSFPRPWSREQLVEEFQCPAAILLVARLDGCLAGYLASRCCLDEAELLKIAVHPRKRCLGIGSALLDRLARQLSRRQVKRLFLEVRAGNLPARELYLARGFSVIARRRGYYSDNGEDALVMAAELRKETYSP
ncbi:MAG: ribosomal protein S18-alanine N-acetyltransferase [Deltaproteobacteria bacterium]|nr:ribosomal protein S18-alanine N-acetyltransferase [Deltaproteobacteria bacterium]